MTLSREQIINDAAEAARHEVAAFIAHDNKEYEKAAHHFGEALTIIDRHRHPSKQVGEEKARQAGWHKIQLLKAYDYIVDNKKIDISYSHPEIKELPQYKEMLMHAVEESRKFGLPDEHGVKKVEWYLQHADWVKPLTGSGSFPDGQDYVQSPFSVSLKDNEKLFVEALTGNVDIHSKTFPIFLDCVLLHDKQRLDASGVHSQKTIENMEMAYAAYLSIIFENMQFENR